MPARSSGEEEVPGIDQPGTPEVPGFDIGWAPKWEGNLKAPIEAAQAFAADLRGRLWQAGLTDVMGAAGFTSYLSGKLREQLAEPLRAAQAQALDYQSRLSADLVQPVMDAVEFGRPFGLYPQFEAGGMLPTDIMETRAQTGILPLVQTTNPAGAQWVLDPRGLESAVQDYQFSVLPLRFADPEEYSRRLQALEDRFPEGSTWLPEFRRRVSLLEASQMGPSGSAVSTAVSPPGGMPIPLPTVPGGGPSGPGVAGGLMGDPGGFFGSPAFQCPPGGTPDTRPPELKNDPNRPRYGMPGVGLSTPDIAEFFRGWPTRSVGPAGETVWSCPIGTQLKYRPNDPIAQCIEPGAAACYGPPAESSLPGGLVPGFPVPGPVEGLPPTSEVPCVKICGLDELLKELKRKPEGETCKKWKAWRDADTGECYVQPADKEPRNGLDKFLLESADCGALIAAVNKECGPKKDRRPEQPAPRPIGRGQLPAQCDWMLPAQKIEFQAGQNPFGALLGFEQSGFADLVAGLPGGLGFIARPVLEFIFRYFDKFSDQFWNALQAFLQGHPCFQGENAALIIQRALVNVLGIFFGDALSQIKTPLVQNSNFLCPVNLPDASAASAAWLRGVISEETWECWVRACGMRPEAWRLVTQGMKSKLTPDQITRLAYRGVIPQAELPDRFRELGYTEARDYQEFYELGRQIPGPSDLVRFMLRDVDDPQIVQRFGLDDEFREKYQGLTRQWAEWQGLDEQTMGRYWRAHWSIPSPTQLYEMFHRLRHLPPGDPQRVELADVETALKQADILPYWIPKLLAVSFRQLRLVDVRRAYFDGTITPPDVLQAYKELGYSDQNADLLTRHLQTQKRLAAKRSPLVKQYAAGEINSGELRAELAEQGFEPDQADLAVSAGRARIEQARRKACSKATRRRFLAGEMDFIGVQTRLVDLGLDADQAMSLAEAWSCERSARGKEFGAAQLCKLFDQGLISGPDFVSRLEKVGWDRDDAIKLFSTCSNDLARKRQLEDLKRIRQEQAEADKRAREQEKAANKLKQEAGDQLRRAENLKRINLAREKAIIDAGGSYSQRTGTDLSESVIHAKNIYRNVAGLTTADRDTIIRSLVISARNKQVDSPQTWQAETLAMANSGSIPEST